MRAYAYSGYLAKPNKQTLSFVLFVSLDANGDDDLNSPHTHPTTQDSSSPILLNVINSNQGNKNLPNPTPSHPVASPLNQKLATTNGT